MSNDRYRHEPIASLGKARLAKVRPLNGYILCRRLPDPPEGLIHLIPKSAEKARREASKAVVVKIGGPEYTAKAIPIAHTVREGDEVIIDKYAGHDIEIEGQTYVMCKEHDVLVIVQPARAADDAAQPAALASGAA